MTGRICTYIRQNVLGVVAIYLALGGIAAATHPGGDDTIDSGDIINNQVRSADVRDDTSNGGGLQAVDLGPDSVGSSELAFSSVGTGEIIDGSVGSAEVENESLDGVDVATGAIGGSELQFGSIGTLHVIDDSLTGADVASESIGFSELGPNSVGGSELAEPSVQSAQVFDNSLTGADIAEPTLSPLDGHDVFLGTCDPTSESYLNCGSMQFTLGQPMEVFALWTWGIDNRNEDESLLGWCRTTLDGANHSPELGVYHDASIEGGWGGIPIPDVMPLSAGTHILGFKCKESSGADLEATEIRIAVIELSFDAGTD